MTFVFTRAKDSIYTNVASINDVKPIAIPESFTSAKITGTTTLTWEGDPVGKDELVEVRVTYAGGSYNVFTVLKAANPSTSISVIPLYPLKEPCRSAVQKLILCRRVTEMPGAS